jgi:hypothetical protein
MISAGPAPAPQAQVTQALDGLQAGVGQVSQAQQANAAQVEAMKRLHDELRAKMAELERLLEQTLGSKMKHDMASQEAAFAELMKHAAAEQAKHAEAMKHAMVDEAKMKAMQQQFEQAARGFDTQKMATDFARQMQDQAHAMEAMKHAMAQQQALNAEAVKHAMEQYKAHADAFQNEQRAAQANSARELYQQLLNKRTMLNGQLLDEANAVPVTDEKATVQAGDVLRVTIGGEPDLPQAYKVSTEGTIRLPFLGAIKVLGLTAAQSREAVGRQLTERRLGSASLVQVTIFRPKK